MTHSMEIDNHPALPIPPHELLPNRSLEPLDHLTCCHRTDKLKLILQVDVKRQNVPAKQTLVI